MRALWSGTISFGLINIPIRLYSGTQEHAFPLDMLHKKDLSPIRYAKICKLEEKEIPYEEIVKGYEYQKGEYVVITPEELTEISPIRSKTIEIQYFTYENEIDSIYFDKPYIVEPDKGAAKAYVLLREALHKSKKVAVASFVLHNKEHLALIKPYDQSILIQELRYANEIRDYRSLELPVAIKANPKEIEIALKLIDQLTEPFEISKFKDTYVEEFEKMIQAKLKGKKIHPKIEPIKPIKGDLMAKLKESLAKIRPIQKRNSRKKTIHA